MNNPRILDVTVSFECPRCSKLTYFTAYSANIFSLEGGLEYCVCCGLPIEWFINLEAKPIEKTNDLDLY